MTKKSKLPTRLCKRQRGGESEGNGENTKNEGTRRIEAQDVCRRQKKKPEDKGTVEAESREEQINSQRGTARKGSEAERMNEKSGMAKKRHQEKAAKKEIKQRK